jgi:ubiquitin C-terminal hydrolase
VRPAKAVIDFTLLHVHSQAFFSHEDLQGSDSYKCEAAKAVIDFTVLHIHSQAFFSHEDLQGSDSYKCEACKCSGRHAKAMKLWHPPPVLLLSLKRFSQKSGSSFFSRFR